MTYSPPSIVRDSNKLVSIDSIKYSGGGCGYDFGCVGGLACGLPYSFSLPLSRTQFFALLLQRVNQTLPARLTMRHISQSGNTPVSPVPLHLLLVYTAFSPLDNARFLCVCVCVCVASLVLVHCNRCLPLLTVVTKTYGLSLEWIGYSRKDFTFPTDQVRLTYRHETLITSQPP